VQGSRQRAVPCSSRSAAPRQFQPASSTPGNRRGQVKHGESVKMPEKVADNVGSDEVRAVQRSSAALQIERPAILIARQDETPRTAEEPQTNANSAYAGGADIALYVCDPRGRMLFGPHCVAYIGGRCMRHPWNGSDEGYVRDAVTAWQRSSGPLRRLPPRRRHLASSQSELPGPGTCW